VRKQTKKKMNFSQDPINTIENLIARNSLKSISIYLVIVLAVIAAIGLLPIINVDISSQSRGVIKSRIDNVPIASVVSGRVAWIKLTNNLLVHKGDTLLTISKASLDTERNIQDTLSSSTKLLLDDLTLLLKGSTSTLATASMREDYLKYTTQRNELQSKINQAQIIFARNKQIIR
jgi:membrane fusion protein, peptide pheromone/bacteriocin exporter